ncbi:beta-N-acetylhexosaminidase [Paenibacillus filicis]|uniref:Beta-N-acetylhexosaminidase n=1 Tax=Paenibacillus gyeongsangnamensis TaxID=3388067 RepID=A0ABT4QHR6_9BACL|nr:beta-N-acetylhexosaminidase [Paenibacillus filicis]MCZ8516424.1 beta-N-acetylhexosaminidase [Paenibacillus filicis]
MRQRIRLLSAALLSLIAIAGCGSKQAESSKPETPPQTSAQPVSPAPQPVVSEPQKPDVQEPPKTVVDPAAELVAHMSLTEKIGQMVLVGMDGTAVQPDIATLIKDRRVGGIILYSNNIVSLAQTVKLANELRQINRDGGGKLPLLLSADQEGGRVSRLPKEVTAFPASRVVGNTNDTKYAYRVGGALGEAMKAVGLNTDFAPVLDVNTNPDNPVIGDRAFGTTAATVRRMGVQEMLGIKSLGVIPVVKHFPGHGDTSVDSHFGLPIVDHDLQRLRSVEFAPFASAIQEGAPTVMVAHILMTKLDPDLPASMSRIVIHNYLRGELKFNGVVFTDDMTMDAVGKVMAIGPASVKSVLAGADIVLVGHDPAQQKAVLDALTDAAKSGKIPQSVIDASVTRIAKLKQSFRLSDEPAPLADVTSLNQHIEAALKR